MAKNVGRVCYGCGSTENIVKDTMVDGERFVLCDNCDEECRIMAADFMRYEMGMEVGPSHVAAVVDPAVQFVTRKIVIEFEADATLGGALGIAEQIVEAAQKAGMADRVKRAHIVSAEAV